MAGDVFCLTASGAVARDGSKIADALVATSAITVSCGQAGAEAAVSQTGRLAIAVTRVPTL